MAFPLRYRLELGAEFIAKLAVLLWDLPSELEGKPLFVRALMTAAIIIVFPILFLLVALTGLYDHFDTIRWSPAPLGHQWKDYQTRICQLYSKMTSRGSTGRVHHHIVELPIELRELVLEYVEDKKSLLILGAVCPCWLSLTRPRIFQHVTAKGESAYDLFRLISSPDCTFLASIRSIRLEDQSTQRTISDALLRKMTKFDISPKRLELAPHSPILPPSRHSTFASSLTELKLEVIAFHAFEGKLSRMAEFISAFLSLEFLDIDCSRTALKRDYPVRWAAERKGIKGHKYTFSSKLSTLRIRSKSGENDNRLNVNIPWTVLSTMPRLESLTLSLVLHENGDFLSTLAPYFLLQGRHLKHLSLELHLGHIPDILFKETLEVMIPISEESPGVLGKDSCSFPELLTLSISIGNMSFDSNQHPADCGHWLLALTRHSPKLEDLMIPKRRPSQSPDLYVTTTDLAKLGFKVKSDDRSAYRGYERKFR